MSKYVIGLDFGTESGRALLVDVANGEEITSAVCVYPHGVITDHLPESDISLGSEWALQDPGDYLEVLGSAIRQVLREGEVAPANVIGLGIDFTSCTMLPTTKDGTPLCKLAQWRNEPHAWVKLWKHHAAQPQANRLNEIAQAGGYRFLDRYGGKVSSEWFVPKVWQILEEAPRVYATADRILEAGDWIVWQLTGQERRSESIAGFKALWSKAQGFPPDAFFRSLDPRLEHFVDEKMTRTLYPLGTRAGNLTERAASLTGLLPGTPVAVAQIDAHASVPAATVTGANSMVIAMGTSNCHMLVNPTDYFVPGMCGSVEGGIVPGLFGYEAGQPSVGDGFAWFVEQSSFGSGAASHQLLEEKAARLKPGESGLLALDWWNGNRSVLVEAELSGVILGLTLATRPEEIYRALIEATAYGTRLIIETFEQASIPVHEIIVTGGLPDRNKMLMQIYADVTGRHLRVAHSRQASAFGSAIFASVAAGPEAGGYLTIREASRKMARTREATYHPIAANQSIYNRLYADYLTLHDYFGRGGNDVMKRLKALRAERPTRIE